MPRHFAVSLAVETHHPSAGPDIQGGCGPVPLIFGAQATRAPVREQPRDEHFGVPLRDAVL